MSNSFIDDCKKIVALKEKKQTYFDVFSSHNGSLFEHTFTHYTGYDQEVNTLRRG